MPKRKTNPCASTSLSSFDAALDLLASDTFSRLEKLTRQFETAVGVELSEEAIKQRWEQAVQRYWVTKSLDDLCCGTKKEIKRDVPQTDS
jgi:hypothetical protein